MGKARILFALILLMGSLFPCLLHPQSPTTIVVLPFTGGDLSKTELYNLTLLFERSLAGVESLQVIDQVRREKVLAYLDPALLSCTDQACAIKVGKGLSASTVVMGEVLNESGSLSVSVRVITVATGRSARTDSAGVSTTAELPQAVRLLASALFGAPLPDSAASGDLTEAQVRQQRLDALESLRSDLMESIAQNDRKRAESRAWGWASLGVGAAAAILSGVSWYLSDLAYQDYLATSDTDEAQYYRRQVVLWDTIMLSSAGAGALCVGVSIPFFVRGPDSRAELKELKRVESEIGAMVSPEGVVP